MSLWARAASLYDPVMRVSGWRRAQAQFGQGLQEVLDVGCGTAYLAKVVGPGYTGVDRELAMLRRTAGSPRVVIGDARALPFGDDSFDVVISTGFLGLLPASTRAEVLSEMTRVGRREIRVLEPVAGVTRAARLALSRHPVAIDELRAVGLDPVVGPRRYFGLYAVVVAAIP